MRHSIACPFGRSRRQRIQIQPFTARDANLPPHQIDAGHHLGDRMLDLQPRVHLEEIEPAVLVEQKLDRAGVRVADGPRDRRGRRGHRLAQRRRNRQRGRLFHDFLMPPLDGTLALDERHAPCRGRRRAAALRCAAAWSAAARGTPTASPKAAFASDRAARTADGSSAGSVTVRMPLPPPPATALTSSG